MKYAIIVTCGEVISRATKTLMTKEGDRCWATIEESGWVDATSRPCVNQNAPPDDLKTFKTREAAERFAKHWKGHPWWVQPKSYEIVEVKPRMITKQDGWERA